MTDCTEIPKLWRENLTHMLGAGDHIRKRQHGYRNYFCASVSDNPDYLSMLEMVDAGLVVKYGREVQHGTLQFFRATESGCKAIGMSAAAIKRALSN
jgi:hypothetical protein